ncbi:uncharacterized protein LOC117893384 [Drosophila subobscura]|uniref:uncharacterized protein LOC117893384 n=1 Tax=Drosophila subobscura TaxID=7241 RepID=UPI00155A9768|nr:uncharacterized protein LOC117893384 [Drosophila subobscura]
MEASRRDVYIPIILAVMIAECRPLTVDDIVDAVMSLLKCLRDQMDFEEALCGDHRGQRTNSHKM